MPALSTDTETIGLSIDASIATVTFQRPEQMNTFNDQMSEDLVQVSETLLRTPGLRAVHLCGKGPVFMAGGDIHSFAKNLESMSEGTVQTVRRLNSSILNLSQLQVPLLASVQGSAAGVGMSFLALADLVIAADDCKFTMAYSGIGLPCDGGASHWLPRLVGHRKAMEMLLLPDLFDAQTAKDCGLVNWIVPAEELAAHSQGYLKRLANGPTQSYKEIKKLLRQSSQCSLETQLEAEAQSFSRCAATQDFATGIQSFIQKQRPKFIGS